MNTKMIWKLGMLCIAMLGFTSCDNQDEEGRKITNYLEYTVTVASQKVPGVATSCGHHLLVDCFAAKKANGQKWKQLVSLSNFDFEEGYEHRMKVGETTYWDSQMGEPSWVEYDVLEVLSKEKKQSTQLPLHFIPEWFYKSRPLPKCKIWVEAYDKAKIERDLKENPILPIDYHYFLYFTESGATKWLAVKDDWQILGPGMLQIAHKEMSAIPDSYRLLPPEGNVESSATEWHFLDASEQETDYGTWDVFLGDAVSSKNMIQAPKTAYLYKDLSQYYQVKYPQADVKTVVVQYVLRLQ